MFNPCLRSSRKEKNVWVERFCQEWVWETLAAGIESFSVPKEDKGSGGGRWLFVITASGTKGSWPDQPEGWHVGLRLAAETRFQSCGSVII